MCDSGSVWVGSSVLGAFRLSELSQVSVITDATELNKKYIP